MAVSILGSYFKWSIYNNIFTEITFVDRYERVDELIWVKTNQLQRIIRTGRTGHWLNHGKEHCLVSNANNLIYNLRYSI